MQMFQMMIQMMMTQNIDGNNNNQPQFIQEEVIEEFAPPAPTETQVINDTTDYTGEGSIEGDPHFVGADGGNYDIMGTAGKTYNILSDSGFQFNAKFDQWEGQDDATIVSDTGFVIGEDNVAFDKTGKLTINGEAKEDGTFTLADGTTVTKKETSLTVTASEYTVKLNSDKDSTHLNMALEATDPTKDRVLPHGLWGLTVDGDGKAQNGDKGKGAQGGGVIDTTEVDAETGAFVKSKNDDKTAVNAYEVKGLHDVDFEGPFNKFHHEGAKENQDTKGDAAKPAQNEKPAEAAEKQD